MLHAPPEPPKRTWNLFERLDYLVQVGVFLIQEALSTRHELEHLMATVAELQTALDANTAATAAAGAAISSEITDLAAAIAALSAGQPVTQAQIDQLTASTSALTAATASLTADDAPVP